MAPSFKLYEYEDLLEVTNPTEKDTIYVLLEGIVHIIADDRTYKKIKVEIRRFRKLKAKIEMLKEQAKAAGEISENEKEEEKKEDQEEGEPPIQSDFPFVEINKFDYKPMNEKGSFGNDKIITSRGFRPSYAISVGPSTKVLEIPVRVIEDAIKKLANTGENKEKTDFMKHFIWFSNFTQSLKTKFNNCINQVTFYPGSKIISEGANNQNAYIVIDGSCRIVC